MYARLSKANKSLLWRLAAVGTTVLVSMTFSSSDENQNTAFAATNHRVIPCPSPLKYDGEVEGKTYECGTVTVPENYSEPEGRSIDLVYLRLISSNANKSDEPVIYLAGGPGGSALGEIGLPNIYININEIRKDRDVIFYDQRGTGYSGVMSCAEFVPAMGVVEELYPDLKPVIETADSTGGSNLLYTAACASGYTSKGVNLAHYTTIDSTKDIAAVADALDIERYSLFGTSYGTRLAMQALRETPERVVSVVLDGVSTPDLAGVPRTTGKLWEAYHTIFTACAADKACAAAHPNAEEEFIALLKEIGKTPITLSKTVRPHPAYATYIGSELTEITPAFFVDLADIINLAPGGGPAVSIPKIVTTLRAGDTSFVESKFDYEAPASTVQEPEIVELPPTILDVLDPSNPLLVPALNTLMQTAQREASAEETDGALWTKLIVDSLFERLEDGEDDVPVAADFVEFLLLPLADNERDAMKTFANERVPAEVAAAANALVNQMNARDIRTTMWGLEELLDGAKSRGLAMGTMLAVHCAEELAFVADDVAEQYIRTIPYPGLLRAC